MPKGIGGGGAGGGPGADAANASASGGAGGAGKNSGDKGKKGKGPKKASQKKKENCKPKSVSQKKYDKLRDKTPSKKIQNAMKKKSKNCYACGNPMVPSVFADHTVPMKQITQMKGFSCMKEKDQVSVLNNPKNFKPLCGSCNSSKGAKKWNEWKGHPKLPIRPGAKGAAVQDAAKLEKTLAASISDKLG